jgi:hypothetical protein
MFDKGNWKILILGYIVQNEIPQIVLKTISKIIDIDLIHFQESEYLTAVLREALRALYVLQNDSIIQLNLQQNSYLRQLTLLIGKF